MKLSMWMVFKALNSYEPIANISNNSPCITGVRLSTQHKTGADQGQYVYICTKNDESGNKTVLLKNGRDTITLQKGSVDEVLNTLMETFEFYTNWHAALQMAANNKDIQQIIDLGCDVLDNPIVLADVEGNVLALSTAYAHKELSSHWKETCESGHLPMAIIGMPQRTMQGEAGIWTSTPQMYLISNSCKLIGAYLTIDGERIADISVWDYGDRMTVSDVALVQMLCDALISALDVKKANIASRSSVDILSDLLRGIDMEEGLMSALSMRCPPPWQLLLIDTPQQQNEIALRHVLLHFNASPYPCIPLLFEKQVVVLVSQSNVTPLLHLVFGQQDWQYYLSMLSLPFDDPRAIRTMYEQMRFAMQTSEQKSGLLEGSSAALKYIFALICEDPRIQFLVHPALKQLKQYDLEKNINLYETLYQYLFHDGSVQAAAQAMHIHKNTFNYRMERIHGMLSIDLNDPLTRSYLRFSYLYEQYTAEHSLTASAK